MGEKKVDILKYNWILNENIIEDFFISWHVIDDHLIKVNVYKAVGPDIMNPFILKNLEGLLLESFEIVLINPRELKNYQKPGRKQL